MVRAPNQTERVIPAHSSERNGQEQRRKTPEGVAKCPPHRRTDEGDGEGAEPACSFQDWKEQGGVDTCRRSVGYRSPPLREAGERAGRTRNATAGGFMHFRRHATDSAYIADGRAGWGLVPWVGLVHGALKHEQLFRFSANQTPTSRPRFHSDKRRLSIGAI